MNGEVKGPVCVGNCHLYRGGVDLGAVCARMIELHEPGLLVGLSICANNLLHGRAGEAALAKTADRVKV